MPSFLSVVTWQMEFKIFSHLFFDKFKIDSNSFPFDEYMELQFEKLILSIIEISPFTWSLFGAYLLWLYLRSLLVSYHFIECIYWYDIRPLVPMGLEGRQSDVLEFADSFFFSCWTMILIGLVITIISRSQSLLSLEYLFM